MSTSTPRLPSPGQTARRRESTVGLLMLISAACGLLLSNLPSSRGFLSILTTGIGPSALGLHLTLAEWASSGLLTVFFLTVGLDLATELTTGSLRHPRQALLPVIAAIGGMALPAGVFLGVLALTGTLPVDAHGWAIPTATDIAFALGAAAVLVPGMTRGARIFLLTLATVDDLLGILIIAVFYSISVQLLPIIAAILVALLYAWAIRRTPRPLGWGLLILGVIVCWGALHLAGVHPTLAGVLIGLGTPARTTPGRLEAETASRHVRPLSEFLVLPLFAITAAAVPLGGAALTPSRLPLLAAAGLALLLGKPIGVLAATWIAIRFTPLRLPAGVKTVHELVPVGLLTGIGFTISLLFAGLAFTDPGQIHAAKLGILLGTVGSGLAAAVCGRLLPRLRSRMRPADGPIGPTA